MRWSTNPASLVGSIDWVTQEFLLDAAGLDAAWAAQKKIDLRYHELSPEGYFRRLVVTGLCPVLVDADRGRPRRPRLTAELSGHDLRGHYIREFAGGDQPVAANWKRVIIGRGRSSKVIHLHRYRRTLRSADPDNLNSAASG